MKKDLSGRLSYFCDVYWVPWYLIDTYCPSSFFRLVRVEKASNRAQDHSWHPSRIFNDRLSYHSSPTLQLKLLHCPFIYPLRPLRHCSASRCFNWRILRNPSWLIVYSWVTSFFWVSLSTLPSLSCGTIPSIATSTVDRFTFWLDLVRASICFSGS